MARLGRYDIIKQLASGALTDLLLGRSSGMEGFQRYVAIKRLRSEFARDPKCMEAFVNEARLAATLHHHNIVQVHDIDQEDGQPYFAMEFVHGVDLRTLLARLAKRNEQLPLQHVVQVIASAAAALHHAHEQLGADGKPLGIVHRAVTPANILVGYDGNVKLVDFGIAKAAIRRIQTDQGVLKGSVPYMAPEQCAGKSVDRRSDIFALGIVLYELATVRRLFKGASEFLTMSAIINAAVPRPSQYRHDIPPELEAIMLKALARDPEHRYQSAGDMSLALDKVASKVGVGASTTALANYMRLQFGEQKEPWLTDEDEDNEPTLVDFDGGASGLAPPANESVQKHAIPRAMAATKSSPIAAARTHALTPIAPGKPVPVLERLRTDVDEHPPVVDPADQVPTAVRKKTPPEPPPEVRSAPDPTQIVTPLPSMPMLERRPSTKLRWFAVLASLIVGGIAAAIVWWPSAQLEPEQPAPAPRVADPAPAEPAQPSSAMTMTMRDYEKAKEATPDAAAPPPAVEETKAPVEEAKPAEEAKQEPAKPPVEEPVVETPPAANVAATKAPAPKRAAAKPAPAKRPPKPAAAAAAPAAKKAAKKWNPDDLFLDEK